jgi:hypothetical protein
LVTDATEHNFAKVRRSFKNIHTFLSLQQCIKAVFLNLGPANCAEGARVGVRTVSKICKGLEQLN